MQLEGIDTESVSPAMHVTPLIVIPLVDPANALIGVAAADPAAIFVTRPYPSTDTEDGVVYVPAETPDVVSSMDAVTPVAPL